MTFHSNMDRMQTMHLMCKRELEQLQTNLSRFLTDSEVVMKNDIFRNSRKGSGYPTHANVFALMAYDRYMSRVASVTNLARKFNIHLQLHSLNKILSADVGVNLTSDPYLLEEFVEWHKVMRDCDEFVDYGGDWNPFTGDEEEQSHAAITLSDSIPPPYKVSDEKYPVGRRISFATPESLTLETMPSCVQLHDLSAFVAGYHFAAFITNIDNMETLSFYACQMRNDMLYELSNMFHLPKSVRMPPTNVVFGISINSKNILRGVIQTPQCTYSRDTDDNLKVLLIDYGEFVPLKSNEVQFYDLPKVYRELPAQAIKCTLLGVKEALDGCIQTDKCELSKKLRTNEFKEVTFEVGKKTGRVLFVYLIEHNQIERKSLEDMKTPSVSHNPFITYENSNNDAALQKAKFGSNNNLKFFLNPRISDVCKNDIIYLEIVHIARPDSFYGQVLKDKSEQVESLFWNTDEVLLEQNLTGLPKIGDLILAQYTKDQFWYRAKILELIDDANFKVLYVDYGNTDTVSLKSMAKCNDAQEIEPFRAVLCRFAGLSDNTNGDESRYQQAVQMLVITLLNQRIEVQVEQKINNEELSVQLLDNEFDDTRQMLINLGYVKESKDEH